MPYSVFLHRSFDYQLSNSPTCILDWAPIRMMVQAVSALRDQNKYEALTSMSSPEMWQMSVTELNYKLNAERNWIENELQQTTNIITSNYNRGHNNSNSNSKRSEDKFGNDCDLATSDVHETKLPMTNINKREISRVETGACSTTSLPLCITEDNNRASDSNYNDIKRYDKEPANKETFTISQNHSSETDINSTTPQTVQEKSRTRELSHYELDKESEISVTNEISERCYTNQNESLEESTTVREMPHTTLTQSSQQPSSTFDRQNEMKPESDNDVETHTHNKIVNNYTDELPFVSHTKCRSNNTNNIMNGNNTYNINNSSSNSNSNNNSKKLVNSSPLTTMAVQEESELKNNNNSSSSSIENFIRASSGLPTVLDAELLNILIPTRKRWTGELICHSYGRIELCKRNSFHISAALYPALGFSCTKEYLRSENMTEIAEGLRWMSENCKQVKIDNYTNNVNVLQRKGSVEVANKKHTAHYHNFSAADEPVNVKRREKIKKGHSKRYKHHNNSNNNNNINSDSSGEKYKEQRNGNDDRNIYSENIRVPYSSQEPKMKTNTYAVRCDDQYLNVGQVNTTHFIRSSQILQLEWLYDRLKWRGVCNVRLKPASLYSPTCTYWHLPCCEYVMQTPWTEWSLQCDEEVLKWNGFLTLYKSLPANSTSSTTTITIDSKLLPKAEEEEQRQEIEEIWARQQSDQQLKNIKNSKNVTCTTSTTTKEDAKHNKSKAVKLKETNGATLNHMNNTNTNKVIKKDITTTTTTTTSSNNDSGSNNNTNSLTSSTNNNIDKDRKAAKTNILQITPSISSSTIPEQQQEHEQEQSNKNEKELQQSFVKEDERNKINIQNNKSTEKLHMDTKQKKLNTITTNTTTTTTTTLPSTSPPIKPLTSSSSASPPLTQVSNLKPGKVTKLSAIQQQQEIDSKRSSNDSEENKKKPAIIVSDTQNNESDNNANKNIASVTSIKNAYSEINQENELTSSNADSVQSKYSNNSNINNIVPQLQEEQEAFPCLPHHTWWRLRHLKVGSGVACKRDFKSGMNLYCGFSGSCGHGLTFAAHMDVLRRLCCSLTSTTSCPSFMETSLVRKLPSSSSSTAEPTTCNGIETYTQATNRRNGRLDMAVRLKVNLITFHSTTLEGGLCYYPFPTLYPHTSLRISYTPHTNEMPTTNAMTNTNNDTSSSMILMEELPVSSTSVIGLHIPDITHELCKDWITSHHTARKRREERQQCEEKENEKEQIYEEGQNNMKVSNSINSTGGKEKDNLYNTEHNQKNAEKSKQNNNEREYSNNDITLPSSTLPSLSMHEVNGTWFSLGWFPSTVGSWLWSVPTLFYSSVAANNDNNNNNNYNRDNNSYTNGSKLIANSDTLENISLDEFSKSVNNDNNSTSDITSFQTTEQSQRLVDTHFPFIHYRVVLHGIAYAQHKVILECVHLWRKCVRFYQTAKCNIRSIWNYTKSLDWLEDVLDKSYVDVSVGVNIYHHPIRLTCAHKNMLVYQQEQQQQQQKRQQLQSTSSIASNDAFQNKRINSIERFIFPLTALSHRDRRS